MQQALPRARDPRSPSSGSKRRGVASRWASQDVFTVGLLVPVNGTTGIWGPSAIACAQLARAEINASGGLLEREVRLRIIDASDEASSVCRETNELMETGEIDGIVGMHTSQVRQRLLNGLELHVPFVYTAQYEGGECRPGVFAIGETPDTQLRPAMRHLAEHRGARRWIFVGNDYVWPRVSNCHATRYVREMHGEVLASYYYPLGSSDFSAVLAQIGQSRPHAVLVSLVGQDAVHFNRQFGSEGFASNILRLSSGLEENGLLGIGADHTEGLHVCSSYFGSLRTDANISFREHYHSQFGQRAPTLGSLGQSTYEGMHFLAALIRRAACDDMPLIGPLAEPLQFRTVRGTRFQGNEQCVAPTYLAEAEGLHFPRPIRL